MIQLRRANGILVLQRGIMLISVEHYTSSLPYVRSVVLISVELNILHLTDCSCQYCQLKGDESGREEDDVVNSPQCIHQPTH